MTLAQRPAHRRTLARRAAGFALLEALIAFAIGGFGLLAIARLQMSLISESDFAKQLSEATFLGQRRLEDLRSFQRAATTDAAGLAAGEWGYGNIASGTSSVVGTNATYTVRWTVGAVATPALKNATVDVEWTDARGTLQTATLHSIIANAEPSMSAGLTVPPVGTPIRRPKDRDLNVPVPAVDLGNGTSYFTPPGASPDVKIVFSNATGAVTKRCVGSGSDPSTWTCVNLTAYLVSGFISLADSPNTPNATLNSPIDLAFTLSEGTLDSCFDDSALSTKTFPNRITYTCLVIGNDHDSNAGTPARWSGASGLAGIAIGSTASTDRICRFSADYDGSSVIENYEHPATYTTVAESLENQNFVIVKGSKACPGTGIGVSVLHQG